MSSTQRIDDGAAAERATTDPILACPATLGDLTDAVRSYGGVGPAALLVSYKSSEKMPGTKVCLGVFVGKTGAGSR